jgi:predicted cupin superfamily sugar epimerase
VGPGFEFADFEMLRDTRAEAEAVKQRHPDATPFV